MMADEEELRSQLLFKTKKKNTERSRRFKALVVVGILTAVYSITEVVVAVKLDSIALLSDGIHNVSDVISLIIAFWALMKSTGSRTDKMTYGWRRTEILGAVMNGCFLVSLSVYIVLEAIPRIFFNPTKISTDWWFISIAASGLAVNTIGTVLFAVLSGGHGHSHAGGGHGHSHGDAHGDHDSHDSHDSHEEIQKKNILHLQNDDEYHKEDEDGHGHNHNKEKGEHGHGHGKKKDKHDDHGHGHKKDKTDDHGHGVKKDKHDDHGHGHKKDKDDDHGHGQKKDKHDDHGHGLKKDKHDDHGHGQKKDKTDGHGHGHGKKKDKHDDHGHDHDNGDGHGHNRKEKDHRINIPEADSHKKQDKEKKNFNIHAVFLHYLGDALSSILVLTAGLLGKYFSEQDWTKYLDPVSSLLIVILIIWTTIPMLRSCSQILLQQAPSQIQMPTLKDKLQQISGVQGVHDLHVWQLVDDIIIASIHISIYDSDAGRLTKIFAKVKKVLHKFGIHSSTLQPEFVEKDSPTEDCDQNCVVDCPEDWCCKTDKKEQELVAYDTFQNK